MPRQFFSEVQALHSNDLSAVRLCRHEHHHQSFLNRGMSHYVLVVYRHAFATAVIAPFALVLERY